MKLTETLGLGGPELVAAQVAELTGVTPHYVFTTGFDGFQAMVDSIGVLDVHSDVAFEDPEYQLEVARGPEQDGRTRRRLASPAPATGCSTTSSARPTSRTS